MKQRWPWKNPNKANSFIKKAGLVSAWSFAGVLLVFAAISFSRLIAEDAHILKIASQFKCICKMNCGLDVGHCPCHEPGGAAEVKGIIRSALKKGLSDDAITSLLTNGGAKPN